MYNKDLEFINCFFFNLMVCFFINLYNKYIGRVEEYF